MKTPSNYPEALCPEPLFFGICTYETSKFKRNWNFVISAHCPIAEQAKFSRSSEIYKFMKTDSFAITMGYFLGDLSISIF